MTTTMTKQEIINKYNSLNEEFNKVCSLYELEFGTPHTHTWASYTPSMNMKKDELEDMLEFREQVIKDINTDIKKHQDYMSLDEETRNEHMQSIQNKIDYLNSQITEITEGVWTDLNNVLASVGLGNWIVCDGYSGYFTIINRTGQGKLNLQIINYSHNNKSPYMTVTSSVGGLQRIDDHESFEYLQFKAYVTICDNYQVFNEFIQRYLSAVNEMRNLYSHLDDTEHIKLYPWEDLD